MNISIRHIEHFVAVAQELHFRRAAQLANVAQPALSRSVQTLENELGVQLLARNNRNVRLTAAGEEFLAGCSDILATMESTIDKTIRAGQSSAGVLSIGYTYIAMCGALPKLMAEFESLHPDIKLEPDVVSTSPQLEKLHHNELDIGFLSGPVTSQELETAVFQADDFVVIAHNNSSLGSNESISVHELSREKILLRPDLKAYYFNQHVYEFFAKAGVKPDIEYVDQDHIGMLGKVAMGRGVCIATSGYGVVYAQNLRTIKLTGVESKLPTIMVWRKDVQSHSILTFRQFMLKKNAPASANELSSDSADIPETI